MDLSRHVTIISNDLVNKEAELLRIQESIHAKQATLTKEIFNASVILVGLRGGGVQNDLDEIFIDDHDERGSRIQLRQNLTDIVKVVRLVYAQDIFSELDAESTRVVIENTPLM